LYIKDPKQWDEDPSDYETWCIGLWFKRNGIQKHEDLFRLFHEFDEKKGGGSPEEFFSAIWPIGMEKNYCSSHMTCKMV
jgi:hypothetical protein